MEGERLSTRNMINLHFAINSLNVSHYPSASATDQVSSTKFELNLKYVRGEAEKWSMKLTRLKEPMMT